MFVNSLLVRKQERERKHFQEVLKLKMKQHKAELDRISRGQPKEVKQQRRAEQEAEIAKKARRLFAHDLMATQATPLFGWPDKLNIALKNV